LKTSHLTILLIFAPLAKAFNSLKCQVSNN
jgi:hypothetical protein